MGRALNCNFCRHYAVIKLNKYFLCRNTDGPPLVVEKEFDVAFRILKEPLKKLRKDLIAKDPFPFLSKDASEKQGAFSDITIIAGIIMLSEEKSARFLMQQLRVSDAQ